MGKREARDGESLEGCATSNLHDGHGIVVKDRGHVFRGEFIGGVADQQTRLSHRTVADHHAPGSSNSISPYPSYLY